MTEKEMIESAGNDWLCNRNGQTSREEDALLTEGFASGAEWAFGEASAIHAEEQHQWSNEREALKRLVAVPIGLPVGTRTREHSCERLLLEAATGDDAARSARYLWDLSRAAAEASGAPVRMLREADVAMAARCLEFLWNDMGEARRLVAEAAALFKSYEAHHLDIAKRTGARTGREEKAKRNGDAAQRLEKWLSGDPDNPAEVMRSLSGGTDCRLSPSDRWRLLFREQGRVARREGKTLGDCPALPPMPDRPDLFAGVSHIDEWIIGWREEDFGQSGGPGLEECQSRFETGEFEGFPTAIETARRIADQEIESVRSNVRPVTSGPLADGGVVGAIADALLDGLRATSPADALSTLKGSSFTLRTADPRFDPAQPVRVNGFLYHPATEDPCKTN